MLTIVVKKLLYIKAADELRGMIRNGTYKTGERLPSEPRLSNILSISRATLRDTLSLLEREGFLERIHGSGTYIKSTTPVPTAKLHINRSITSLIISLGLVPGTRSMKVSNITATPEIASKLLIDRGSPVIRIERTQTANKQPVVYSINLIPEWLVPYPPRPPGKGEHFSLCEFLKTECYQKVITGIANLQTLSQLKTIASILKVNPNSSLFFFEQIDLNQEKIPIVFSREYAVPWLFKFSVERTI